MFVFDIRTFMAVHLMAKDEALYRLPFESEKEPLPGVLHYFYVSIVDPHVVYVSTEPKDSTFLELKSGCILIHETSKVQSKDIERVKQIQKKLFWFSSSNYPQIIRQLSLKSAEFTRSSTDNAAIVKDIAKMYTELHGIQALQVKKDSMLRKYTRIADSIALGDDGDMDDEFLFGNYEDHDRYLDPEVSLREILGNEIFGRMMNLYVPGAPEPPPDAEDDVDEQESQEGREQEEKDERPSRVVPRVVDSDYDTTPRSVYQRNSPSPQPNQTREQSVSPSNLPRDPPTGTSELPNDYRV
jgi:hypothetical protein